MARSTDFITGFILPWEVVYARGHHGDDQFVLTEHDPDDPGGATRYGIDKAAHPQVDVEHLTRARAIALYEREWQRAGCAAMPAGLGECYFNASVNCGASRALKILKVSAGSAERFLLEQAGFYHRLVQARPKSAKYLDGWLNRVHALSEFLHLAKAA